MLVIINISQIGNQKSIDRFVCSKNTNFHVLLIKLPCVIDTTWEQAWTSQCTQSQAALNKGTKTDGKRRKWAQAALHQRGFQGQPAEACPGNPGGGSSSETSLGNLSCSEATFPRRSFLTHWSHSQGRQWNW